MRTLATYARVYVSDLDHARGLGAEVVRGPADPETGRNATVRLASGAVAEYVRWTDEVRSRVGV